VGAKPIVSGVRSRSPCWPLGTNEEEDEEAMRRCKADHSRKEKIDADHRSMQHHKFVVLLHYTSLYFCMHAGTIISRFITISSQTLSSWNGHAVITNSSYAGSKNSISPTPTASSYLFHFSSHDQGITA